MGNGIGNSQFYDLWVFTLSQYDYSADFEVLLPLHNWEVCDVWFGADQVINEEGGKQIARQIQVNEGEAHWTRPTMERTRSLERGTVEVTAPWCGVYSEYSTTKAELRRNRAKAKLKSLARKKRIGAHLAMCKGLEQRAWWCPTSSADDLHPWGVPYWIVPITGAQVTAGTGAGAHQGAAPTGWTTVAGITPGGATDDPNGRWKNYNATWTNSGGIITATDAERMGRMFRHMKWRTPRRATDLKTKVMEKFRLYTCETILDGWSKFVREQNDSLGADGGRFYGAGLNGDGEPLFKGHPLRWIEELDTADATYRGTYPLYGIDGGCMHPIVESGANFDEDTPPRDWRQPDVFTTFTDLSFQFWMESRQRGGAVISYVAAA